MYNQVNVEYRVRDEPINNKSTKGRYKKKPTKKKVSIEDPLLLFSSFAPFQNTVSVPTHPQKERVKQDTVASSSQQRNNILDPHHSSYENHEDRPHSTSVPVRPLSSHRRPSSGNSVRRIDPLSRVPTQQPKWNNSGVCKNRDVMNIDLDAEILQYRAKHNMLQERRYPAEPQLVNRGHDRERNKVCSIEARDRNIHHSFGYALNDPLPFCPYLRKSNGIHTERWSCATKMEENYDDYAKPAVNPDRFSSGTFHDVYDRDDISEASYDVDEYRHLSSISTVGTHYKNMNKR